MHEHRTRNDSSDGREARSARVPAAPLSAAGNRAISEVLTSRPVQRWPDLGDLGGMFGGGSAMGNPTPDMGGVMPSMPSMPSMPDLGGLLPGMPNIPGVSLDVDTDAGTASGGIDFHNGTSGRASYGPNGLDAQGQTGRSNVSGHASALNDWNVQGGTTTQGGATVNGSLADDHGSFGGNLGVRGAGGDQAQLSAHGGPGGFGGFGSYSGEYGNLGLPF